jgi:prepilin-type N-terminal cleavage/methylation domain-containing protein
MRKRNGFTLVELVVVVMILGILAAVAAPKLLGTSSVASDNGIKQTLATVRDAIERYAAEHGGVLPGADSDTEAEFLTEIGPYLRGDFPKCPTAGETNKIKVSPTAVGFGGEGGPTWTESWHYCSDTGQFIVNSNKPTVNKNDDDAVTYDQL